MRAETLGPLRHGTSKLSPMNATSCQLAGAKPWGGPLGVRQTSSTARQKPNFVGFGRNSPKAALDQLESRNSGVALREDHPRRPDTYPSAGAVGSAELYGGGG